jgi:serine protease AprX
VKPALRLSRTSPPARHWLRFAIVLACAFTLGAPLTAGADSGAQTTLSPGLLAAAQAAPDEAFRVIVEGAVGTDAASEKVRAVAGDDATELRSFLTVPAVAGTLTGSEIVALAQGSESLVITRDSPVTATDDPRPDDAPPDGTREVPTVAGDAVSPPSIIGTAEQGQTLHAADGAWDGTEPLDFAHQWQRCDGQGETCADIAGATAPSYTLGSGDVGATLRLAVTAGGPGGERSALSDPSEPVLAIPEPQNRFKQHWPYVAGVASLLSSSEGQALEPPTIAIVDSGIDAGRADFGGRVIEEVNVSTRQGNQPGDGYGHGTAVASVAAGEAEGYVGAAPDARLVAVEALDDDGVAYLSDVIAAADWIYLNRARLNIRVANFSLHGTTVASLVSDPLDRAVERLWLSGVVVVAAAGNYAINGEESFVPFAPGNDPFVLTVGATDTRGSFTQRDDVAAPWSAWGYTRDGFAKPELGAPGRYIAAAVSAETKLARERPERIVEPGYMQLSGTSLAAPVVAGTAANLLAAHPEWTPDQVKGALMLTAEPLARARPRSAGVGALSAARAAAAVDPPNPNLALQRFLVPDPSGGSTPVFDAPGWTTVAQSDPAWASVAWGSVAWGSAAWSSVAWGSVAWGSVAWGSVAWGSVAWGSVAWGSKSEDDLRKEGGYWIRRD